MSSKSPIHCCQKCYAYWSANRPSGESGEKRPHVHLFCNTCYVERLEKCDEESKSATKRARVGGRRSRR